MQRKRKTRSEQMHESMYEKRAQKEKAKIMSRKQTLMGISQRDLFGAGIVVFFEPFLDSAISKYVPQASVADDLIKLGIGGYFAKRHGLIGGAGKALAIISAARVISRAVGGSKLLTTTTTTTTGGDW